MTEKAQNFENHTKRVPAFHFVVLPIFFLNIIWCIERVIRRHTFGTIVSLLVAIALLLLAFNARIFALTVQNRIIRLEMQLRLQQVLPQNLKPRIAEFTLDQLVSLRFASDAELPELARKVLDEKLNDRKAIKKLIRNWQPDFLRA
ncbi:MAG: DUF6526 family protein [Candidatus Acidiferrales bacterium]